MGRVGHHVSLALMILLEIFSRLGGLPPWNDVAEVARERGRAGASTSQRRLGCAHLFGEGERTIRSMWLMSARIYGFSKVLLYGVQA
jgi:hypothetical protein